MRCINCGNELPDSAAFCDNCGSPVKQAGKKGNAESSGGSNEPLAETASASAAPATKKEWKDQYSVGIILALCLVAGVVGFAVKMGRQAVKQEAVAAPVQGQAVQDEKAGEEDTAVRVINETDSESDTADTGSEKGQSQEEAFDTTEGGIHSYGYFIDDCTWNEAFYKSKENGGYLARINSREEYNYILSEISSFGYDKIQFRIGARRDADSTEYYWVDENNNLYGEQINTPEYWAHSEWMQGEPSFRDGDIEEDYIDFYYYKQEGRWVWNDVPDDIISIVPYYSGKIGYIVEYEN